MDIIFAYRSFKWESEARGKAHVTVVILGLAKKHNKNRKRLFDIEDDKIFENHYSHISPYLIGSDNILPIVSKVSSPLNGLSKIKVGTQLIDGGHYTFTEQEKKDFLKKEPLAESFIVEYINAKDFINGNKHYILSLSGITSKKLKNFPETKKRIDAVKKFRLSSKRKVTRELAQTPTIFAHNVIPTEEFLLVPRVSSEQRNYVPVGYVRPPVIPSDAIMIIENATLGLFGLITSKMHMVWLRTIGGKLESRLRYSGGMVYNTFPIPNSKLDVLDKYVQEILNIRKKYPNSTLADMYDPDTTPPDLKKIHDRLDRAVEKLYRKEPFKSDEDRLDFLLEEYQKMISKQTTL